ncbi:emb [Venturia nashicola]|uniref:Emb n=1 Tax=Venturia nashicola TaxID=86259 RepID=A0A4Z1PC46_9PEZI|nr:emb [Venturia nashicola]TLD29848.1 emb [Venturia nashicola]
MAAWKRLIRFVPKSSSSSKFLIGEPVDQNLDVGLALYQGKSVKANVFSGSSVLDAGNPTGESVEVERVLSPVTQRECGTIRCIGLNYVQHAKEVKMALPTVPTLFMKPSTSLNDPYPSPVPLPRLTKKDDCGDWESELAVILSKDCKNVTEEQVPEYILGYTASNDVSSRVSQLNQSQWCFSKGFDGSCPIGPVLVSPSLIPNPSALHIRGLKNKEVMQDCGIDELIFGIPKLVSFLSQSTTLPAGTVIVTGTPAGVGLNREPKGTLKAGDEFTVEILPYIGSLVNKFVDEE